MSSYFRQLTAIDGELYLKKLLTPDGFQLPDPYELNNWYLDITLLPNITWVDVINYLVFNKSVFTKENLQAYKSLEAYNYFLNGHVQECYFCIPSQCPKFIFVKTKVLPSQRQKAKNMYDVWICLCTEDGSIHTANCTCMAGLGSACSHVAAVLFKLQSANQLELNKKASTDFLCEWNQSRKSVNPMPISRINFKCVKPDTLLPSVSKSPPKEIERNKLCEKDIKSLYEIMPKAVYFLNTNKTTLGLDEDSYSTDSTSPDYCFEVELPPPLTDLHKHSLGSSMNENEQKHFFTKFFENVTPNSLKSLENYTQEQHNSKLWHTHRAGRITASRMYRAFKTRSPCSKSVLNEIMQYQSVGLNVPQIKYGRINEKAAKDSYIKMNSDNHKNLTILPCGLLVDFERPWLASSPDGILSCDCHPKRLLEIKCPYNYRTGLVDWEQDKNFPVTIEKKIKTGHAYYYQIQGQLGISNFNTCEFMIWTPKDTITISIEKDEQFIENMFLKLDNLFFKDILPELIYKLKCPA